MKGTGALTFRQEKDLAWYFSHADADTSGVRSNLQSTLARKRDNTPRLPLRSSEPSEQRLADARRAREIANTLAKLSSEQARALERFYGPGKWERSKAWGKWAPLIPVLPSTQKRLAGIHRILRDPKHAAAFNPAFLAMNDVAIQVALAASHVPVADDERVRALVKLGKGQFTAAEVREHLDGPTIREAEGLLRDAEIAYRKACSAGTQASTSTKRRSQYQKLVTIREAARILDLSEGTIKRRLDDGSLPYRMAGKQRRVLLTSDKPFPDKIGVETRGRKRVLTIVNS